MYIAGDLITLLLNTLEINRRHQQTEFAPFPRITQIDLSSVHLSYPVGFRFTYFWKRKNLPNPLKMSNIPW
jgi:hypothetical protein